MGILLKGVIKKAILSEKPFKQNLATMPEYRCSSNSYVITDEKKLLVEKLEKFKSQEGFIEGRSHPICGPFTKDEWGFSMYKHLDHHLSQFGK